MNSGKPKKNHALHNAIQNAKRRAASGLRKSFNIETPLATNSGWVSTIHTLDESMQHADHYRFMERFQPRPDVAAGWMFNGVKQS